MTFGAITLENIMPIDARMRFSLRRNEPRTFVIRVIGLTAATLTAASPRMQIRETLDASGAPLVELGLVTDPAAKGIRIVEQVAEADVPSALLCVQIDKATASDPDVFPYGALGEAKPFAYGLQWGGVTRLRGVVEVVGSAIDCENAPTDRGLFHSGVHAADSLMDHGATLTIANDQVIELVIDGAGETALNKAKSEAAAIVAKTEADRAEAVTARAIDALDAVESTARFYDTRAQALASVAIGALFVSDETGTLVRYLRIASEPGFVAKGAVVTQSQILQLRPEDFGAVGDGVVNDSIAFQRLSAAINANKGGVVAFRPGAVYLVGGQTFAGRAGLGYAYQPTPGFRVSGVDGLHIIGNGARIQMVAGQRYGGFDPVTGEPAASSTNNDRRAYIDYCIRITNSRNIVIENLTCDGALESMTIGGNWDPPAIQLHADGLYLVDVERVMVRNVVVSGNARDGIYLRGLRRTKNPQGSDQLYFENVTCDRNGRQGLSWIGGYGLTCVNCTFSNTSQGSAYTGNPAAGVDIEPNSSEWASEALFLNCTFENNAGAGLLADTGNSKGLTVRDCEFWQGFSANGTTVRTTGGDALWTSRANVLIENCRIHGTMTNTPGNGSAVFRRCAFDDAEHPSYGRSSQRRAELIANCPGQYEDCTFTVSGTAGRRIVYNNNAYYRRCTFSYRGSGLGGNSAASYYSSGDTLEDCTLLDAFPAEMTVDPGGYLYVAPSDVRVKGKTQVLGPNIKWRSRTGFVGDLAGEDVLTSRLRFGSQDTPGILTRALAVPTAGTYARGDIVFNRQPVAGGALGWVCTASGTPGTWKTFATIAT